MPTLIWIVIIFLIAIVVSLISYHRGYLYCLRVIERSFNERYIYEIKAEQDCWPDEITVVSMTGREEDRSFLDAVATARFLLGIFCPSKPTVVIDYGNSCDAPFVRIKLERPAVEGQ